MYTDRPSNALTTRRAHDPVSTIHYSSVLEASLRLPSYRPALVLLMPHQAAD